MWESGAEDLRNDSLGSGSPGADKPWAATCLDYILVKELII